MYSVAKNTWEGVTGPSAVTPAADLFPNCDMVADCLRVLKLHGSLNWYSTHTSSTPSRTAMFRPERRLSVTRRKTIAPDMALAGKARKVYTLPVIVPPVTHKSSVLHSVTGPRLSVHHEREVVDVTRGKVALRPDGHAGGSARGCRCEGRARRASA